MATGLALRALQGLESPPSSSDGDVRRRASQNQNSFRSRSPGSPRPCPALLPGRNAGSCWTPRSSEVDGPHPDLGAQTKEPQGQNGTFARRGSTFAWLLGRQVTAMAKSKKKVEVVFLACEETGDLNYTIRRKSGGEKLKLSKYSPRLRKHTLHVEKKKR